MTLTLGEKLAKLRREHHYTQEQLAHLLGVSRKSVSKWESNLAYPETEKLLKLGALYQCSMDYLLKDEAAGEGAGAPGAEQDPAEGEAPPECYTEFTVRTVRMGRFVYERKSRREMFGLPLWHINLGPGRKAKGIIAIGQVAKGGVAIGLCSLGVVSVGLCSVGVVALGALAVALLSLGSLAVGVVAVGAGSVGVLSIGALAVGKLSVGALAVGEYFALGDHAIGMIALGDTKAVGSVFQAAGTLTPQQIAQAEEMLHQVVPVWLGWAKGIVQMFLRCVL